MSEERFSNILSRKDFKPTTEQHLNELLQYIKLQRHKHAEMNAKNKAEGKKVTFDEKVFKKLQTLMKETSKVASHFPETVLRLVEQLLLFFKDLSFPIVLTLLFGLIGPDLKFQSISKPSEQRQTPKIQQESSVIALSYGEESIIALPNSQTDVKIATHGASDVGNQQNRQQNQKYYIQDDEKLALYLQNPFKTVKRNGISDLFERISNFILTNFIQPIVNQRLICSMPISSVLSVLKLIEYLDASIYTFYFLSLIKQVTDLLLSCFCDPQLSQSVLATEMRTKMKRSEYEELIYQVKSLAERWSQHKQDFNLQEWDWRMEQRMIISFLESSTSEKQLAAVKTLIDRCRKVDFNSYSVLNQEGLIKFIEKNDILQKIYRPENHPQVIIKGKQVFEFVSKHSGLNHELVNIIFELIPKSNENICKALYSTLQSAGHTNLENNREYIMKKISSLPRANLFSNETFSLIQSLILLAPIQIIEESLKYIYEVISTHYFGMKPNLKQKILNIYFEVYLMGVEEGQLDHEKGQMMIALEPFLNSSKIVATQLNILIIDKFIQTLKEHIPKKIGSKCKKIINTCIQVLFNKYHIHRIPSSGMQYIQASKDLRLSQLGLIRELLQAYDKQKIIQLLEQKQLWELIEEDSYFGRYLSYYSSQSQLFLLQKLISKAQLTQKDIQNIIESYYFMDNDVKEKIFTQIKRMFMKTSEIWIKQKLADFVSKIQNLSPQQISNTLTEFVTQEKQSGYQQILAVLIELKQLLAIHDKRGCGSYPAFKYITCDYSVKLKVLNMVDVLNPLTFDVDEKNYKTLYDALKTILLIVGKSLKEIKLKIDKNQKYVSLQELKQKLNELSPYRQISITIEQSSECQWYDQSLLMNKQKELNPEVIQILKEVFTQYATETTNQQRRLFKPAACKIFQLATNTELISVNDTRILHLFNNYSETGQFLTLHEWINFYYQSALVNPNLVVDNLRNLGYSHFFQTASEVIDNFQVQTENKFRQYFAKNQSIYSILFKLLADFRKIQDNREQVPLRQKIMNLAWQILKQLPKYDKIQNLALSSFFYKDSIGKNNEVNSISELNNESIEEAYFIILFISSYMQKMQKDFSKDIPKIQNYLINRFIVQIEKLLEPNSNQIDALNLSFDQYVSIVSLQQIGSILARPQFQKINKSKGILKCQIQEASPLFLPKIKINASNKLTPSISKKLQNVSAINSDLLVNYASILLFQMNRSNQLTQMETQDQSSIQTEILEKILHRLVYQENVLFNKETSLSKLSNHLVYLFSESIQGLTHWFVADVVNNHKSDFFQSQHVFALQYLKTLNQIILIETNCTKLSQIGCVLFEILQNCTKKYSYAEFFQNKKKSQHIEGILLCLKTIYSSNNYSKLNNNKNVSSLSENLLTNFVLSEKCQSYLYQIISSVNNDDLQHNLDFAYKKFSQLQLKKNSKLNTQNQSECGIINLGCTCYINSVFQQLYHITDFSQAIINAPQKQTMTQPYFTQFQRIFYNLKYSKRSFVMTNKFCQNYIDFTGQPINTKQQHDADQFLNNLLDKLQKTYENNFNVSRNHTIIRKQFQGSMANVITCQNCFTNKVNVEDFYVVSLEIKNLTSLSQCVEKMVEPEVICDYYCNTCDKKVEEIHKYRKFETLPNILFIHLQRLVFDLETFSKIKLDNPINFAEQIDFKQYFHTEQNQSHKYKLSGFIVHFGNSEGGHYVSLIQDKEKKSWKKYDDSKVSKWFWKTGLNEKDNAYLLIYEKVDNKSNDAPMQDESQRLNEKLLHEITEDNISLGKQITVIRPEFGKFLINELEKSRRIQISIEDQGGDFEQYFLKTKLIWKYLKILDQARSVGFSDALPLNQSQIEYLGRAFIFYNRFPETVEHFLSISVEQQLLRSVYQSSQKKLRQIFAGILINIITSWTNYFSQTSFMIPTRENETIRKLLGQIENSLSEVGKSSGKMQEFFELLVCLIKTNIKVKEYFKQMNIVPKLVNFIMHKDSVLKQKIGLYPLNMPTSKKLNSFNSIVEIISFYLDEYPDMIQNELIQLGLGERNFEFYKYLYEYRYENHMKINSIVTKFCYNNIELTSKVIEQLILNKINRFNYDDFYIVAYLDLIYCLLSINDTLSQFRMYRILGIPYFLFDLGEDSEVMLKKKKQRMVSYWNNYLHSGDQIIFPFLELLYTNRNEVSYFSVVGIIYLLQLIRENQQISRYIASLPSPCKFIEYQGLIYEKYSTWITEYLKNTLKQLPSLIKFEKIDLKQSLNKISLLIEDIQAKQFNTDKIETEQMEMKQIITEQNELNMKTQVSEFSNAKDWLQRNSPFILGEIVQKSETRLSKLNIQGLKQEQMKNQIQSKVPFTYCIFKTMRITDPIAYTQQILIQTDVIQPNQQFEQEKLRKAKKEEVLQKYLSSEVLENSLVQISFSGSYEFLSGYRNKNFIVKVHFLFDQYHYEVLIDLNKLLSQNQECKITVPTPKQIKHLQVLNEKTFEYIEEIFTKQIKLSLISLKNAKGKEKNTSEEMREKEERSQPQKDQTQQKDDFPTIEQTYGQGDAYFQQTQQNDAPIKEQVCIQCPFCGYISHEFASRCPGCNEEWGLYA